MAFSNGEVSVSETERVRPPTPCPPPYALSACKFLLHCCSFDVSCSLCLFYWTVSSTKGKPCLFYSTGHICTDGVPGTGWGDVRARGERYELLHEGARVGGEERASHWPGQGTLGFMASNGAPVIRWSAGRLAVLSGGGGGRNRGTSWL